jgi:hypothetical protein
MSGRILWYSSAICLFFGLSSTAIADSKNVASRFAQAGTIMTASTKSDSKASACDYAITMAKALCADSQFHNVTKVSCDCSENNSPPWKYDCIGTATCQK